MTQLELQPISRPLALRVTGFPMPPSVNACYSPSFTKSRIIKSKEYRAYEKTVMAWLVAEQLKLKLIREFIKDLGQYVIHVDSVFHMPKSEIITKDGKPKRNDTSNRIKALHDVLAGMIMNIDDSYFWSGSFSKEVCEGKAYVDLNFELRLI